MTTRVPASGWAPAPRLASLAVLLLVGLLGLLALPAVAAAEEEGAIRYREFRGRIDRINKKNLIVDNRMGDKLKFVPAEEVEIIDARDGEGRPKDRWKDLKKNDWVSVSWLMMDHPRKAYKVRVMPPKKEAGDDVD